VGGTALRCSEKLRHVGVGCRDDSTIRSSTLVDRGLCVSELELECTPLEVSLWHGGEPPELSESERGVNSSWGIPESARRRQRGVVVTGCNTNTEYKADSMIQYTLGHCVAAILLYYTLNNQPQVPDVLTIELQSHTLASVRLFSPLCDIPLHYNLSHSAASVRLFSPLHYTMSHSPVVSLMYCYAPLLQQEQWQGCHMGLEGEASHPGMALG
jgi:hypothetical protein